MTPNPDRNTDHDEMTLNRAMLQAIDKLLFQGIYDNANDRHADAMTLLRDIHAARDVPTMLDAKNKVSDSQDIDGHENWALDSINSSLTQLVDNHRGDLEKSISLS